MITSVLPFVTVLCHLGQAQCLEVSLHDSIPRLARSPSSQCSIHFECSAFHYTAVISHTHHMSIPAQSSLLHATSVSSYTQFFSQHICALSFLHTHITHPAKHAGCSSHRKSSAFMAPVSLPCSTALCTQASYNLPFTRREKPFVVSRGSSSLNIFPPCTYSGYYTFSTPSSTAN